MLCLLIGIIMSCSDSVTDQLLENNPPTVTVFLQSDGTLSRTSSNQILHWDGKDSDGLVVGFWYSFGNSSTDRTSWIFLSDTASGEKELENMGIPPSWMFTTERSDTFILSILTDTVTFTFSIMAEDDEGALSTDVTKLILPIKNTKPEVFFLGETDTASSSIKIPDTTFTIASFVWSATDIDGEETIEKFQYALTSPGNTLTESDWKDIPGTKRSIILSGTIYETEADVTFDTDLSEGDHAIHLRAVDAAGAFSEVKRLPEDSTKFWYVKETVGNIFIIDDWKLSSTDGRDFYTQTFDSLGRGFSVLDIKPQSSQFLLSKQAFVETAKLFDIILWYADGVPQLELADAVLSDFPERGGKIIFTTLFAQFASNQGDPLGFTPVDSISLMLDTLGNTVSKIFKSFNVELWPDPSIEAEFPDTLVSNFLSSIIASPKEITPKLSARVLYRFQLRPDIYSGEPVVIIEDATDSFIFASIPLHYFDGNKRMGSLLSLILTQEFGL